MAIKHVVETLECSYWVFNIVGGVYPFGKSKEVGKEKDLKRAKR
jgi:hypothetical protein